MKYLVLALLSISAYAASDRILNWKETQGITEQQALEMAREGVKNVLSWEDEDFGCEADEFWSFEYDEANVVDKTPAFAVELYANGSMDQCESETTFDCRVLFKKNADGKWYEEYTDCEPAGLER